MIAADNKRRLELAFGHHVIERQASEVTFTQTQPADARRETLERNAFARHVEPTVQMGVMREEFLDLIIGLRSEERRVGKECRAQWWSYDVIRTAANQIR